MIEAASPPPTRRRVLFDLLSRERFEHAEIAASA